jgi:dsDNA-binding SOS-regulon protein
MEYIILLVIILGFSLLYIKNPKNIDQNNLRIIELEKTLSSKESSLKELEKEKDILNIQVKTLDEIKSKNTELETSLKSITDERNNLKNQNIRLNNNEEKRILDSKKEINALITLKQSAEEEKQALNNSRVLEKEKEFEKMKSQWLKHEKDVEISLREICRNYIIKYVGQEEFPHARNKPDNSIEIMDQLIVFDAKSPSNNNLDNFPKYIKDQTENLKKYAKHDDVKNDLFLVIPSNTLHVINQFSYKIGDYNVFVITKDALEPIILSLKKIEEYEFVDKLSPEERDNICSVLGKFAHTTKRRIQIDNFFQREFLNTLDKAKKLPREILESVIEFENSEKLNPPIEKRKKTIFTKDLKAQVDEVEKDMEIRNIPKVQTSITFNNDDKKLL